MLDLRHPGPKVRRRPPAKFTAKKPADAPGDLTADDFASLYGLDVATSDSITPTKSTTKSTQATSKSSQAKSTKRSKSATTFKNNVMAPHSPNPATLKIYETHLRSYLTAKKKQLSSKLVAATHEAQQDFLRTATTPLDPSSTIFEIGSGEGNSVADFAQLGLEQNLMLSDAPESFLGLLCSKGFTPFKFNALTDPFPHCFDCIYAWDTLCHFNHAEMDGFFKKVFIALAPGGLFIFNLPNADEHDGRPEAWLDGLMDEHMGVERYYSFWTEELIKALLFRATFQTYALEVHGGSSGRQWFYVAARKRTK